MGNEFVDKVIESGNATILDAYMKCQQVFSQHEHALVSISGGADSDCMLDLCEHVRRIEPIKVTYAWFNTGLEYEATKRHLGYLEERYGVTIERVRPLKSIPTCARDHGQPFLNKYVSERMERLQRHGFQWEDEPLDVLLERYPRCKSSLRWWTNDYTRVPGVPGQFDIGYKRWLKEFIIANPPQFNVSNKCCDYTKKKVAYDYIAKIGCDVDLIGVRKAEGGIRASKKECFSKKLRNTGVDRYRPLFWFSNSDKEQYESLFDIRHSECYTVYGFKRTGCAGCPYNLKLDEDMAITERFDPGLYKAVNHVFRDAYAYTKAYRQFRKEMDEKSGGQMRLSLRHARTPQ